MDYVANSTYVTNLACYLLRHTGSVLGEIAVRLTASEQRELFGRFLGRGKIVIDGAHETIANRVRVCFGHDYDDRNVTAWRAL